MLLVIDVGNTNTVLGLYQGTELKHHFRISTSKGATSDEYGTLLLSLLERHGISAEAMTGCIPASVVPHLNRAFETAASRYDGV